MSDTGKTLVTLELEDLMRLLPHRYPFLLIDRVINVDGDSSCIGIKNVTVNEPFFPGHFPARPVMPGVLLIEGMAQTAGAICTLSRGFAKPPKSVLFLTVDKAKFRRPVVPGDIVEYHMIKKNQKKSMWWFHGEAKVRGELAAEADVGAMIVDD